VQECFDTRTGRISALAVAFLIALSLILGLVFMSPPRPHDDALRYIAYAVNLHDHGVFSLAIEPADTPPEPGSGHVPLYPAWLAAVAALDGDLHDTLVCLVAEQGARQPCQLNLGLIVAAQLVLAGIFFACVWLLAKRLSGNLWIAWLAAFCALLARNPLQYANQLLTEALLLPLLALFTLFLAIAYQDRRPRWMLAAGAMLGLAAMTRPAYAYLFYAMTGVLLIVAFARWRRTLLLASLLFAVAYSVVVLPWMVRNKALFDRFALTTVYAGDILAQRIAYNRMSWAEFGVSFIYWFPDVGDHLAHVLFPRRYSDKLSWDPGSYYVTVAPDIYRDIVKKVDDPEEIVPFLLRTEILAHPIKHALVSLPLAFRAMFISKYWGVAGLICFIVFVIRQLKRGDYTFLVLSLPIWFMVAFHALVSVSIPRYNLALIPFYAYAMAWVIYASGYRFLELRRRRKPAD